MNHDLILRLFEQATDGVQPPAGLVERAVARGERRRRRARVRAAASGLAVAGVLALGAVTASPALRSGGDDPAVVAEDRGSSFLTEASPPSAGHRGGLAGTLASLLADRGAVSGLENWLPYGPAEPGSPVPTLDDGSPGRAGQLLLDGENVSVIVTPRMGAQCGPRAADNPTPNCRRVDGGFVQTGAADVTTPPGETGQASADSVVEWAAFYTGEIEVVINANDEVLPLSELVELAQDPAFRR